MRLHKISGKKVEYSVTHCSVLGLILNIAWACNLPSHKFDETGLLCTMSVLRMMADFAVALDGYFVK